MSGEKECAEWNFHLLHVLWFWLLAEKLDWLVAFLYSYLRTARYSLFQVILVTVRWYSAKDECRDGTGCSWEGHRGHQSYNSLNLQPAILLHSSQRRMVWKKENISWYFCIKETHIPVNLENIFGGYVELWVYLSSFSGGSWSLDLLCSIGFQMKTASEMIERSNTGRTWAPPCGHVLYWNRENVTIIWAHWPIQVCYYDEKC